MDVIISMSDFYLSTQQWWWWGDTPLQDLNGYVPPSGVIIFQHHDLEQGIHI